MNLDAVSLKAIVKELSPLAVGGVIQKISQLTRLDIVMQVRKPGITHKLLFRLEQDNAGLGLTEEKLPPAEAPTAFVMLLRKYLQGKKIDFLEQHGLEKIVKFSIGAKILLLEIYGRSNNLYLLNETGRIMGMLIRDTKSEAQQAGKLYQAPTPPNKPDASLVSFQDIPNLLQPFSGQKASKALQAALFGLSSQQASFICRLAGLSRDEPVGPANANNLAIALDQWQMLLDEETFSPVLSNQGKLSPWSLGEDGESPFPSMLKALDTHSSPPGIDNKRLVVQRLLTKAKEKAQLALQKRLEALESTKFSPLKRLAGELILANLSKIAPHSNSLILDDSQENLPPNLEEILSIADCSETEPTAAIKSGREAKQAKRRKLSLERSNGQITVALNPLLSASENAQAYFKEYHRLKRAVTSVQEPIKRAQEEIEFLDELLYFAEVASEAQELEDIRHQWSESKKNSSASEPKKTRSIQTGPLGPQKFTYQNFTILAGRNPRQNDLLTFKIAAAGDIWLHSHGVPGAHVIIKTAGRKPGQEVIEAAAVIAARHCRSRRDTKVEISFCDVKQVKKPKGSPPGRVLIKNFKTLLVNPYAEITGLEGK
ncbi:MAG: NFACT family protein [Candidatus Bruticola sp.]